MSRSSRKGDRKQTGHGLEEKRTIVMNKKLAWVYMSWGGKEKSVWRKVTLPRRPKFQLVNFYLLKCFTHGLLFTFVFCLFAQFNVTVFREWCVPCIISGTLIIILCCIHLYLLLYIWLWFFMTLLAFFEYINIYLYISDRVVTSNHNQFTYIEWNKFHLNICCFKLLFFVSLAETNSGLSISDKIVKTDVRRRRYPSIKSSFTFLWNKLTQTENWSRKCPA